MSVRVCLVTTGQPSTNPRLVKEADALTSAGYEVHVIGAHWAEWADRHDPELIAPRQWSCELLDWRRGTSPELFWKSKLRHAAARAAGRAAIGRRLFGHAAAGRLTPELSAAARAWTADLYIAHNLGALPAAAAAAARHDARLGFDAEDFHSGQTAPDDRSAPLLRFLEAKLLPRCDYVTASSPGIADAYEEHCRMPPTVVLNVFPLADRPPSPHASSGQPLRLYWFSQTIGRDRGLESVVAAMGMLSAPVELHLRGEWQPGFEADLMRAALQADVSWERIVRHEPGHPDEMVRLAATFDAGIALEPGHTVNSDIALSNKVFTYLLAGLPVLASATTAQAELFRDCNAAAVVVPVGNAVAIADALQRWIDRPATLGAARCAAWELGTQLYNWDREQEVFLDVVRDVLDRRVRAAKASGFDS